MVEEVAQEGDGGKRRQCCVKPRAGIVVTGDQDETSYLLGGPERPRERHQRSPGMPDYDRALEAESATCLSKQGRLGCRGPGSTARPFAVAEARPVESHHPAGGRNEVEDATHDPVIKRDGVTVEENNRRASTLAGRAGTGGPLVQVVQPSAVQLEKTTDRRVVQLGAAGLRPIVKGRGAEHRGDPEGDPDGIGPRRVSEGALRQVARRRQVHLVSVISGGLADWCGFGGSAGQAAHRRWCSLKN